jgi:glutaredoxin
MNTITVYTTEGCRLCDEVLDQIAKALEIFPFYLMIIEIKEEPALFQKFKNDVPVVLLNGDEIGKQRIESDTILKYLKKLP